MASIASRASGLGMSRAAIAPLAQHDVRRLVPGRDVRVREVGQIQQQAPEVRRAVVHLGLEPCGEPVRSGCNDQVRHKRSRGRAGRIGPSSWQRSFRREKSSRRAESSGRPRRKIQTRDTGSFYAAAAAAIRPAYTNGTDRAAGDRRHVRPQACLLKGYGTATRGCPRSARQSVRTAGAARPGPPAGVRRRTELRRARP